MVAKKSRALSENDVFLKNEHSRDIWQKIRRSGKVERGRKKKNRSVQFSSCALRAEIKLSPKIMVTMPKVDYLLAGRPSLDRRTGMSRFCTSDQQSSQN